MAVGDVYADGFRRTSDGALYVTFDNYVTNRTFGIVGDGTTISATKLDALVAFITDTTNVSRIVYWDPGTYRFPSTYTMVLTGIRGFKFIGNGASSGQRITRFIKSGTGASDDGLLQIVSCTDYEISGIQFLIDGASGAKQAVEVKANDIPSLSDLLWKFTNCVFSRNSGTPEFTVAAVMLKNTVQWAFERCAFPTAAVAMRLGESNGVDPSTYGNGHVTLGTLKLCHLFGDLDRRNCSQIIYDQNFHDLKTGTSAPACMTASGDQRIRNETLLNFYCDPGSTATDKTRTFYVQGTHSGTGEDLAQGLFVRGGRINSVAIGFDLVNGNADIDEASFYNAAASAIGIRVGASAVGFKTPQACDFTGMIGAGAVGIQDNRASGGLKTLAGTETITGYINTVASDGTAIKLAVLT